MLCFYMPASFYESVRNAPGLFCQGCSRSVPLAEVNRTARHHPNQTVAEIEQLVLELRQAHMRWGPRKLKRILERDQPGRRWPAASTMGEMLRRESLVGPRPKRRRSPPLTPPLAPAAGPNPVWVADIKGWVCTRDTHRTHPLHLSHSPTAAP